MSLTNVTGAEKRAAAAQWRAIRRQRPPPAPEVPRDVACPPETTISAPEKEAQVRPPVSPEPGSPLPTLGARKRRLKLGYLGPTEFEARAILA